MGSHLGAVRIHGKHPLTPSTCFVGLNNTYLFIYCLPVSPNRYNLQDHEDPACFVLCCICSTHNSVCGISIYFCGMNEWMSEEHFREPMLPAVLWLCWLKLPQCVWLVFCGLQFPFFLPEYYFWYFYSSYIMTQKVIRGRISLGKYRPEFKWLLASTRITDVAFGLGNSEKICQSEAT